MKHAIIALVALVGSIALLGATNAHAQGFNDQPTCYSWEGGHKSAGSFSKCSAGIPVKVAAAPAPAPAVVAAPIVQAPAQSCAPPPKPVIKRKPKPAPLKC